MQGLDLLENEAMKIDCQEVRNLTQEIIDTFFE